mmetsp:Transcript_24782/g.83290  ORF Transcript_24782/g.83290 Transcript_24782/m.83290 type:complete len:298 (+) Transcript_24782:86-979(+)
MTFALLDSARRRVTTLGQRSTRPTRAPQTLWTSLLISRSVTGSRGATRSNGAPCALCSTTVLRRCTTVLRTSPTAATQRPWAGLRTIRATTVLRSSNGREGCGDHRGAKGAPWHRRDAPAAQHARVASGRGRHHRHADGLAAQLGHAGWADRRQRRRRRRRAGEALSAAGDLQQHRGAAGRRRPRALSVGERAEHHGRRHRARCVGVLRRGFVRLCCCHGRRARAQLRTQLQLGSRARKWRSPVADTRRARGAVRRRTVTSRRCAGGPHLRGRPPQIHGSRRPDDAGEGVVALRRQR